MLSLTKVTRILACAGALILPPLASAHMDEKEPLQSYRQSFFALVVANFGPLGAMAQGDIPWDDDMVQAFSADLQTVTSLNLMRGFAEGSEKGTTRAKPEIWENLDDFEGKLGDLRAAVDELSTVVASGEREQIAQQVGTVGKACKACHDDYKSKDYLY